MQTINEIKNDTLSLFYKGKRVTINLTQELSINENVINGQLKNSPSNYAFLCLLRDRAIYKRDKLEKKQQQAYSNAWVYYKESGNINNDLADHKATIHSKYVSITERLDKINYRVNILTSACKAYESREKIMQTVSANLRKQQ